MLRTNSLLLIKVSWVLLFSFNGYAQEGSFSSIQSKFEEEREKTLQEKIYVHTDKATYLAGDIIWFKIYNTDANTNKRLGLSKVAYIEIISLRDSGILQQSIFLNEGLGNGSFALPVNFQSGSYRLRAYTNWMKNSGSNIFFEKVITVINTLKFDTTDVGYISNSYYVDLFPEGGSLVFELQSRVAFKITDSTGAGTIAKLYLLSNQDTIGIYATLKFGMGSFRFTPTKGKTYSVSVALPNGQLLSKNLPLIYDDGYIMNVEKESELVIKIAIQSNPHNNTNVSLAINNNERLVGFKYSRLNDGKTNFSIPIKLLGDGVNYFTLFNNKNKPVCERLYFLSPANLKPVIINTDAKTYATRDKVTLNFQQINSTDFSPQCLSLSVYRIDSLQHYDQINIANYLTLLSNLKGRVEAPDYYLSGVGADYEQNVDNLMLTNGWRRFYWENILNKPDSVHIFPLEYKGPIINGMVINNQNLQPVKDVPVFLSIPGRRFQFYATKTQDQGRFWFDAGKYFGDGNIIIQTKNNYDNLYKIILKSPYWQGYNHQTIEKPVFSFPQNSLSDLERHHIATQAQNIYFKNQRQYFISPAMMDSLPFFGSLGRTYLLDNYTRFTSMEDIFREYITEINVTQQNGRPHISILDESRKTFFKEDFLCLIDGVAVFNEEAIFDFDPLKVQKLQVISQRYMLGPFTFNGILSLITYKGNYQGLSLSNRAMAINYRGMQFDRQFYSPAYETEYQYNIRIPDFRSTIYWSTEIDCKDTKGISFYTSDFAGKYIANLQGLSNSGKPFSCSANFEVSTKKK